MSKILSVSFFLLSLSFSQWSVASTRTFLKTPNGVEFGGEKSTFLTGRSLPTVANSSVSAPTAGEFYFADHSEIAVIDSCSKTVGGMMDRAVEVLRNEGFYIDYTLWCSPYDEKSSYILYQIITEAYDSTEGVKLREWIAKLDGQDFGGITLHFKKAISVAEEGKIKIEVVKNRRKTIFESSFSGQVGASYLEFDRKQHAENLKFRASKWEELEDYLRGMIPGESFGEFSTEIKKGDEVNATHWPIFETESGEKVRSSVGMGNFRICANPETPCPSGP